LTYQEVHIGRVMMIFWSSKPFLCREAIEEANFGDQFRELRSTFFSVVGYVGFLKSRRTEPDQFVILLTLFWCTFESLKINKKASPTETKARRRRQSCLTLLTTLLLWFVVICAYILIWISLWWLLWSLINLFFFP